MFKRIFLALSLCAAAGSLSPALAQQCTPPAIVANVKSANIFTPEQETVFGDLMVENMADEFRFVRDEQLLAYVNDIGARLARHLPPTGLTFRFYLVDIPEANAFNIPGGHVFLTRKLVAFVQNEDELAGVMAHELGHAVVRHGAVDTSVMLKKILNVTSLGDRRDVTEKYNLLIERARTRRIFRDEGHENEQQLEADRVGLYAMTAAGYDPAAFSAFFDRLTENKGKTGSWLSELFGATRPVQKRMRDMVNATKQMPASCREGRSAKASENFLKWQADVVSFRSPVRREELPGLVWKKELAPKLRSDVSHFSFSPDGRLLLAQDDFAVHVIEREPLRVLFQIPVEGAQDASFTPDGTQIVLTTESRRFERWSVAERKPIEVRELVTRGGCWEHGLSPDGNYLACVSTSAAASLLDTRTGQKVWEKKDFYRLDFFEYIMWLAATKGEDSGDETGFFRIQFTPDSRYVVLSRSERFRFRFSWDGMTAAASENTALALDLPTLKQVDLGGDLKKIAARPYVFLDGGRLLGMPTRKAEEAGVFAFPSGKRLQKLTLGANVIKRTASPDYVLIKPLANARVGLFDLKRNVVATGMNKEDMTIWNNLVAFEAQDGRVLLREVSYNEEKKTLEGKEVGRVELPVSSLKGLNAAEVSDSFGWLLLSSKTRGGLWNLSTGERKFYVRGFRGGLVAEDGASVGDFPTLNETPHSLVVLNPNTDTVAPVRELPEQGARQYGRFVLTRSSLKTKPAKDEKKGEKGEKKDEKPNPAAAVLDYYGKSESDGLSLGREVRFELKDIVADRTIWSRDFPKEAPEFSFDEFTGRLIFYWRLAGDAGKAKLRESAELQARADALGNKADDLLVEVVDAFAQKTIGMLLVETGQGSFSVSDGLSEGDWLLLHDSEGRVLVYSIKDGQLRHRFFGRNAAINPQKHQVAVENFPGEVTLYDLDTGDRRARFVVNGSAAFVRFNLNGSRLFVLSDAQSAYAFDLTKIVNTNQQAR
jgi:WD40 repeat protein